MKKIATLLCISVLLSVSFRLNMAQSATGIPKILNYQGRLLDASGNLLGGSAGAAYCFTFALYDASSGGSKLWPSGTPATSTVTVRNGVFNAGIGDTSIGSDALTYNFQDNDTIYLEIGVAERVGASCTNGDETLETLTPRQQVFAAGYAINSDTVDGYHAREQATGTQIAVLTQGELILASSSPSVTATGTNALTIQNRSTGNINLFSSATGTFSQAGTLTIAGLLLSSGSGNNYFAGNLSVGTSTAPTGGVAFFNGNVGINVSAPEYKLQIGTSTIEGYGPEFAENVVSILETSSGSGNILNSLFYIEQTAATTGSAQGVEGYVLAKHASGDVNLALGVAGNAESNGAGTVTELRGVTAGAGIGTSGSGNVTRAMAVYAQSLFDTGSGSIANGYGIYVDNQTAASTNYALYATGTAQSYFGGNVGIGAKTPAAKLEVVGNTSSTGAIINGTATTTNLSVTGLSVGSIPFITTSGVVTQNNSNLFWDNSAARLGIGTTAPGAKLEVAGTVSSTGAIVNGNIGISADTDLVQLAANSVTVNGSIGIGAAPSAGFDVDLRKSNSGGDVQMLVYNSSADATSTATLQIATNTGTSSDPTLLFNVNAVGGVRMGLDNSDSDKFKIQMSSAVLGTTATGLTLTSAGSLGINQASPLTNSSIDVGSVAPGVATPYYFLLGYGANTNWPFSLGGIYDGSYVDSYMTFNGYVDGGTRSSPTFTGGNNGGSFIRRQGDATPALEFGYYSNGTGQSGTTAMSILSDGSIGIGTTTPASALHVLGDVRMGRSGGSVWDFQSPSSDMRLVGSTSGADLFLIPGSGGDGTESVGIGRAVFTPNARLHVVQNDSGNAFQVDDVSGDTTPFIIDQTGSVGIGTTTPNANAKLHVVQGTTTGLPTGFGGNTSMIVQNSDAGTRNNDITFVGGSAGGVNLYFVGTSTAYTARGAIKYNLSNDSFTFRTNNADVMTIDSAGEVGISTTTPSYKLEVNPAHNFSSAQDVARFHAIGDIPQRSAGMIFGNVTDSVYGGIKVLLGNYGGAGNNALFHIIQANTDNTNTSIFSPTSSSSILAVMNTGKVGIGTSTPQDVLHVIGDIRTSACASDGTGDVACVDVAETYRTSENMEAGDLVVVDSNFTWTSSTQFAVKKAEGGDRAALLGIVSTRPALLIEGDKARLGGPKLEGAYAPGDKAPIALVGRVPVKISEENGAILPGDKLTVSSQKGIAMKAKEGGWVAGIALEHSAHASSGKIMAFVNPVWWGGEPKESGGVMESIVTAVRSALESLGIFIQNGIAFFENITARNVVITKAEIEEANIRVANIARANISEGIQFTDRATGKVYCAWIENGDWVKQMGACGATPSQEQAAGPDEQTTAASQEKVEEVVDVPRKEVEVGEETVIEEGSEHVPEPAPEPVREPGSAQAPEEPAPEPAAEVEPTTDNQ